MSGSGLVLPKLEERPTMNSGVTASIEALFQEAESQSKNDSHRSIEFFKMVLSHPAADQEALKRKEIAVQRVGELMALGKMANDLDVFIRTLDPLWSSFARAKTARLIKILLECFDQMSADHAATGALPGKDLIKQIQLKLTKDLVAWSQKEKRTFLKQSLEVRLASLYLDNKLYGDALDLVGALLKELKKMDDKLMLIDVHLLECRIYFVLRNGPKAKAALTAARSNANSIYCPPLTQAALDMQSALVHADDGDFKTAYSYFIEALDSYSGLNDPRGAQALKYLLFCKIMLGHPEEIDSIIGGKLAQNYSLGEEVNAMKAIGQAYITKSLKSFEHSLEAYPESLGMDPLIHAHFQSLYDQLLQSNLLAIIKPYGKIDLAFIAERISLPIHVIESKLCLMILDKQLNAIIDQYAQTLILIDETIHDKTFKLAMDGIKNLNTVVDSLYLKATNL